MIISDPWLFIDLAMLAAGLLAVISSAVWLLWLFRKHGVADAPDDILRLSGIISKHPTEIDLASFVFEKNQYGRDTYSRIYHTCDGTWTLTVEMEGSYAVAFQARLKHDKSCFMGRTMEGGCRDPKIIVYDGCGG